MRSPLRKKLSPWGKSSWAHTMARNYFITWNRSEYKEWATPTKNGYGLLIIRREPDNFLVVKAKLIVGEKGLPGFDVLKEYNFPDENSALAKIKQLMD